MPFFLASTFFTVIMLFLTACSSQPDLIKHAFINTHIEDNNSKLFTFYATPIVIQKAHQTSSNKQAVKSKEGGKGKKAPEQRNSNHTSQDNLPIEYQAEMRKALLKQLNSTLEQNKYCREGYIELGMNIGRGLAKIKGECHESATEADKKRFPNIP